MIKTKFCNRAAVMALLLLLTLCLFASAGCCNNDLEQNTEASNVVASVAGENGIRMAAARTATQGWTLTASVNDGALDEPVDWAVRWKDGTAPDGSTDTVVSHYVTVTPTSDGAMTATAACLKPFTKPIEVVVSLRSDSDVSAVCQFDYVKKVLGMTYTVFEDLNVGGGSSSHVTLTYELILSDGTIEPEIDFYAEELFVTGEFLDYVANNLGSLQDVFSSGSCWLIYYVAGEYGSNSIKFVPCGRNVSIDDLECEYVDGLHSYCEVNYVPLYGGDCYLDEFDLFGFFLFPYATLSDQTLAYDSENDYNEAVSHASAYLHLQCEINTYVEDADYYTTDIYDVLLNYSGGTVIFEG